MTPNISPVEVADFEEVFAMATSAFAKQSTIHAALGISVDDYAAYLRPSFRSMIDEGLSLKAVNKETGAVLGAIIATDLMECLSPSPPTDPRFAPISALTQRLLKFHIGDTQPQTGSIALVDMGFTAPEARGHGIYTKLRVAVHDHLKELGYNRVLGELSSVATQHVVLDKFGHRAISEITFKDFEYGGETPFAAITEPSSIILSEGILE